MKQNSVPQHSLSEQPSVPSVGQQAQAIVGAPSISVDDAAAPELPGSRSDLPVSVRKSIRARQKWDDPFSLLYDPLLRYENSLLTFCAQ